MLIPFMVLLLGFAVSSCKKDKDTSSVGTDVQLLINNLSPDVYPVQLYINNVIQNPKNTTTTLAAVQTYAAYSYNAPSGYFNVKSSGNPIQLRSTKSGDSILFTTPDTVMLKSGVRYSLFITGLNADRSVKFIYTTDYIPNNAAQLPSLGKARVRFLNASIGYPAGTGFDVYANGTRAFNNITFNNVSGYAELPAGIYDFKFVAPGASIANSSSVIIDLPNITVQDGRLYTIYSRGVVNRVDSAALGAGVILNN